MSNPNPLSMYRTSHTTPTVMGLLHQFMEHLGIPPVYDHLANTINTRRTHVLRAVTPDPLAGESPRLQYFGVGIGGTTESDNTRLNSVVQPYVPLAGNHDLFTPIPVRVVPVSNDLSGAERLLYRLRTRFTGVDNIEYFAYWLKCIEFSSAGITVKTISSQGSVANFGFSDTSSIKKDFAELTVGSPSQLVISSIGTLQVTAEELANTINVLFAGQPSKGFITEIGLYTGFDRIVPVDVDAGIPEAYTDAAYVHLAVHNTMRGVDVSSAGKYLLRQEKFENGSSFIV